MFLHFTVPKQQEEDFLGVRAVMVKKNQRVMLSTLLSQALGLELGVEWDQQGKAIIGLLSHSASKHINTDVKKEHIMSSYSVLASFQRTLEIWLTLGYDPGKVVLRMIFNVTN